MKKLTITILCAALPAYGWQKVCTFTFDKKYDGVRIGKVNVFRQKETNSWSYAVGLSGVTVTAHDCAKDERLTAYVGAKVKSSSGGYLDTGDLKVRGKKRETYWKFFDEAHLKDCLEGARIWTSWICEKAKAPAPAAKTLKTP